MKYMLLIYGDESAMASATPEQNQAAADEYEAFTKSITTSGNFLDGDPFMPTSMATTVSAGGGSEIGTTGGPAVTTSPQLLAYYKVEADGPRGGHRDGQARAARTVRRRRGSPGRPVRLTERRSGPVSAGAAPRSIS